MASVSRAFTLQRPSESAKEPIEMSKTQQEYREQAPQTPRNAPEQRSAGFASGEADPAKYPGDLEIGRFSSGQDASEPIERGCFAEGQETKHKAIDPKEGFDETER
jgi:hypothetical protein